MAKARRGGRRRRPAPDTVDGPAGAGREHWRADGTPKTRYRDQDEANRASLRMRLDHGADLDPYLCRLCGGWHLGNRAD